MSTPDSRAAAGLELRRWLETWQGRASDDELVAMLEGHAALIRYEAGRQERLRRERVRAEAMRQAREDGR